MIRNEIVELTEVPKEIDMEDVKSYCDNVVSELGVWKGKIDEVVSRIDRVSSGDKAKIGDQVNDLHMFMGELESRIDTLKTECPTGWKPEGIELEPTFAERKTALDEFHRMAV